MVENTIADVQKLERSVDGKSAAVAIPVRSNISRSFCSGVGLGRRRYFQLRFRRLCA
jgi:hypothetical protein